MSEWNFQRTETTPDDIIPKGPIRVRIAAAEKMVSKKGNDMLRLILDVSGHKKQIYHYITFMPNNQELTNRLLTQFFDSFAGIPEGEFNTAKWVGAEGAAMITHDSYNGLATAKVSWFIHRDNQAAIPEYVDVKIPENYAQPQQEAKSQPQPQPVIQQTPEIQPVKLPDGSIPVIMLPDGSIQMPDGRVLMVQGTSGPQQTAPKAEEPNNFGPNQSWNNGEPKDFASAYAAFMGDLTK